MSAQIIKLEDHRNAVERARVAPGYAPARSEDRNRDRAGVMMHAWLCAGIPWDQACVGYTLAVLDRELRS